MKKFFCNTGSLGSATRIMIYTAGFAVAKNNQALATAALPVAKGLIDTIKNGGENAAVNALFRDVVGDLAARTSDNPVIAAAVSAALSELSINVDTGAFPVFSNEAISGMVDSFIAGATAALPATK